MRLPMAQVLVLTALGSLGGCPSAGHDDRCADETPRITPSQEHAAAGKEHAATHLLDPGAKSAHVIERAIAILSPTEDHKAKGVATGGTVRFKTSKNSDELQVVADFDHLPPGKHAFHVHVFGDCSSDDGKSAGTHFNFDGSSLHPPSHVDHITGNLGEVEADASGLAHVDIVIKGAYLTGPYSILGRSIIVHEKGNDPDSPPLGDAGSPIACGVIGFAKDES